MDCGHDESLRVKSVESDYQFCELCEARKRAADAEEMERYLREQLKASQCGGSGLFVIRQRGRRMYWTCSNEHGCGWNPQFPKQAFTKSELAKEVFRLIDRGWFTDCEIVQLRLPGWAEEGKF